MEQNQNNNQRKQKLEDVGEEIFAKRDASSAATPPDKSKTEKQVGGKKDPEKAISKANRDKVAPEDQKRSPKSKKAAEDKRKDSKKIKSPGIFDFEDPAPKKTLSLKDSSSSKNNSHTNSIKRIFKGQWTSDKNPYKEYRHFEIARKAALTVFSLLSLVVLLLCVYLGYSYSGDSIRVVSQLGESYKSDYRNYIIVYSESDPFGAAAAEELKTLFANKTGSTLKVVSDSEKVSRHEIRIGHTNRSGDDYLTSVSALGSNGYAIIIANGDNINITAFSAEGASAASKYFVNSYVGEYRRGKLIFSNKMNFSYVSKTGTEPGTTLRDSKITLNFSKYGRFKILILSDADTNPATLEAISAIAEKEKPGLVIFAGDVSSGLTTRAELEAHLKTLTATLEEKKIPWTVCFGEQDIDGGLTASAQMEVYSSFKYCVAKSDFVSGGAVSAFIPIFAYRKGLDDSTGADAPIFGVWTMGQTPMLSMTGNGAATDSVLSEHRETGTDYGYVSPSHVAWFSESDALLDREAGGVMPSIMVTHTPLPEMKIIAENPGKTELMGNVGELVSSSPINSGLFSAVMNAGGVSGIYFGHDHLNSFYGKYCGVEMGYCASIGYDGYGLGGNFEINNSLRGGRIIELTQSDDGNINTLTRMVYASDYN